MKNLIRFSLIALYLLMCATHLSAESRSNHEKALDYTLVSSAEQIITENPELALEALQLIEDICGDLSEINQKNAASCLENISTSLSSLDDDGEDGQSEGKELDDEDKKFLDALEKFKKDHGNFKLMIITAYILFYAAFGPLM